MIASAVRYRQYKDYEQRGDAWVVVETGAYPMEVEAMGEPSMFDKPCRICETGVNHKPSEHLADLIASGRRQPGSEERLLSVEWTTRPCE